MNQPLKFNIPLTVNSAVSAALAFLLMHFLNEFATASVAAYFGLKPVMYVHSIKYNAYYNWTPYIVNRTFIASGIANLILGIVFLRVFNSLKKQNYWYRFFVLWCALFGVVMFLGKILAIPFYEAKPDPPGHIAFGVIAAYRYMGDSAKWLLSVFSVLLMVVSGLFFSYRFLRTAETKDQLKKGKLRRDFIFTVILVPYLAGMFFVAVVNYPNNFSTLLVYFLTGLAIILSSLSFAGQTSKVLLHREEPQKISKFGFGFLALMIIFYWYFYTKGIGCKGYFDFLLCCDCGG